MNTEVDVAVNRQTVVMGTHILRLFLLCALLDRSPYPRYVQVRVDLQAQAPS